MLIKAGALKADQNKELGSGSVRSSSYKASEEDYVVSEVVLRNQKMSSPSDVFVSTTVASNMLKALSFSTKNPETTSAFADAGGNFVEHVEAEVKVEAVAQKSETVVVVAGFVAEPVKAEVKEVKVEAVPVVEKPAPVAAVAEPVKAEVKEVKVEAVPVVEKPAPVVVAAVAEPVKAEVKVEAVPVVEKPAPVIVAAAVTEPVKAEVKVEAVPVVEKPAPVIVAAAVAEPVKAEVKEVKVEAVPVVEKPAPVVVAAVAELIKAEMNAVVAPVVEVVLAVPPAAAVVDAAAVTAEPSLLVVEELCPVEEDCEL